MLRSVPVLGLPEIGGTAPALPKGGYRTGTLCAILRQIQFEFLEEPPKANPRSIPPPLARYRSGADEVPTAALLYKANRLCAIVIFIFQAEFPPKKSLFVIYRNTKMQRKNQYFFGSEADDASRLMRFLY